MQRLGSQAAPGDRVAQYHNFRDYSWAIERQSGLTMVSLSSSTYGAHYWHKTGLYTTAGAETSQSNGNAQLLYAFIRGSAKQYGLLWYGQVRLVTPGSNPLYLPPIFYQSERRCSSLEQVSSNPGRPYKGLDLQCFWVQDSGRPGPDGGLHHAAIALAVLRHFTLADEAIDVHPGKAPLTAVGI